MNGSTGPRLKTIGKRPGVSPSPTLAVSANGWLTASSPELSAPSCQVCAHNASSPHKKLPCCNGLPLFRATAPAGPARHVEALEHDPSDYLGFGGPALPESGPRPARLSRVFLQ